jgi:Zn-dependent M28 family amino/carboxypeptidase
MTHSLTLIITFLFLSTITWGQKKYAESINIEDISSIVKVLTSDTLKGREAGTEAGRKASTYIASLFNKYGLLQAAKLENEVSYFQKVPLRGKSHTYNVLGFIKGSSYPDEAIIITAHYDHLGIKRGEMYRGADDNASGVSALLEIGQAFSIAVKDGSSPKRSIVLLALGAEEKGMIGSAYYTDENPIFTLKNTVVNLNMDMIGHLDKLHPEDPNFVSLVGSDWQSSDLHQIHEQANKDYVGLELDYTFNSINHPERFFYRSDQYNFAKHGIPVIFYTSGDHHDYHKPTDTIENLQLDRIQKVAQLVFYTAWDIANRKDRIIVDKTIK